MLKNYLVIFIFQWSKIILNILPDFDSVNDEFQAKSIYINFYPINCKLEIHEENPDTVYLKEIKTPFSNNDTRVFYKYNKFTKYCHFNYYVNPKDFINGDTCLLYLSSYDMTIPEFYPEESIILKENQPQLFSFNNQVTL